jgi:3-phytase
MLNALLLLALAQVDVQPLRETKSEPVQTDDPSIWVHPKRPAESLIIGTVKMAAPDGAIAVYKLDGQPLMRIPNVDRPNNVDVAYGLKLGGRTVDIAVATERNKNALRVFEIEPGKGIRDLGSIPVFEAPMGVALHKQPKTGKIFAIVSRKTGPSGSYLWQYELKDDGKGGVMGEKVREFGKFSGSKEIEAIAVDDELGFIYYSDEGAGIRKYSTDPANPNELALFATEGWQGDREGIALYKTKGNRGYLIATDQQTPNSVYHVFSRVDNKPLGSFRVGAATTDGIDATARPLGAELPKGLFIAMNDSRKNFILVDWRQIEKALKLGK